MAMLELAIGGAAPVATEAAKLLVSYLAERRAKDLAEEQPLAGRLGAEQAPDQGRVEEAITRLRDLQKAVLTFSSDLSFTQKYARLAIAQARVVYEARTPEALELACMEIDQIEAAWSQVRRNLERRTRAIWWAAGIFVLLLLALLALGGWGPALGMDSRFVLPILDVPVNVVLWSAIGSCSAILYRVNRATGIELEDPLRLLMTRPLIGVVMGTVSYLIVQLGLLTLSASAGASGATGIAGAAAPGGAGVDPAAAARATYFLSFVSFLVGFSDRLADGLLRSLAGGLGGPKDGELVAVQTPAVGGQPLALMALVDELERRTQRGRQTPDAESTDTVPAATGGAVAAVTGGGVGNAPSGEAGGAPPRGAQRRPRAPAATPRPGSNGAAAVNGESSPGPLPCASPLLAAPHDDGAASGDH